MIRGRKWLRVGVVVLVLAIVMMQASAAVATGPDQTGSRQASEEQLKVLTQLWGQDITMGEVLEQVLPEALEGKPEDLVEQLYTVKMIWPAPPDPTEDYPSSLNTETATKSDVQPKSILIFLTHISSMDVTWPWINFSSSSRVWLPHPWYTIPYMAAWSWLWYWTGTESQLISSAFADGVNVYKVSAEGDYYTSTEGQYCVTGAHYGVYPPGSDPPTYYATTFSGWKYVSP